MKPYDWSYVDPEPPTFDDLRRMTPQQLAEWHRATGIEERVLRAIAEADDHVAPCLRLPVLVIGVALAVVTGWLLWMALGWRAGG